MRGRVKEEERTRIVEMLREGMSQNRTAKESGRGHATVNRIARAEGLTSEHTATKKANAARRDYAQAARLELLNEGFEKARELLPAVDSPHKLQAWMIGVGIAVDKRRLEDGEATERGDYTHREASERDLSEYFAELDELRASHSEADTS